MMRKLSSPVWLTMAAIVSGYFPLRACAQARRPADASQASTNASLKKSAPVHPNFLGAPVEFQPNRGQFGSETDFVADAASYSVVLQDGKFAILPAARRGKTRCSPGSDGCGEKAGTPLVLQFAGAASGAYAQPVSSSGAYANYLIGNDPAKWRTRVPLAERVRTRNLYPGVDLDFYGTQGQLEYDLTLAPGADPSRIQLRTDFTGSAALDKAGELVLRSGDECFVMHAPAAYQTGADGERQPVQAVYRLTADASSRQTIGFELGAYDHARPVVIDPTVTIVYAGYLGGSGDQYAGGIAVDASGSMYVTGTTNSTDFPTANPEQTTGSIFVTKLNAAGTALVYSTYLGGTSGSDAPGGDSVSIDTGHALAVDSTGTVYLVGTTASLDFPVTASAFQATSGSNDPRSGFLLRLSADGSTLLYSSFFGDAIVPISVTADNSGHAYMIGSGQVPDVPVTSNAYYAPSSGTNDYAAILAFVSEFDTTKSGAASLPYSTLFGHVVTDGLDVALDSAGNLVLLGATGHTLGAYGTIDIAGSAYESAPFSIGTAWVAKFSLVQSVPTSLVASTYMGGAAPTGVDTNIESPTSLAVDGSNNVYITGTTLSNSFPVYRAINPNQLTSVSGFLTAFQSNLQYVVYSTYIGDDSSFGPTSLAVAANGDAVLTGFAGPGLTVVNGIPSVTPPVNNGGNVVTDAVLIGVPSGGGSELYATYLGTGGGGHDFLALDSSENAYLFADDGTITPTPGAFQSTNNGGDTPFLMKLSFTTTTTASIVRIVPTSGANTGVTTVTVHGTGFQTGATLTLNCAGQSYSGLIFSQTDSLLSAYVDLRGAAVGPCDVVVATSTQGTVTAAAAFQVDGVASPQVFTQVVGPSMIREGTGQVYTIAYGNSGNTDVYSVPLYITFPEFLIYSVLTPVMSPSTVPGGNPVDYTQWPLDFNDGNGNTVVALILPIVRAGSNNILEIRLEAPNQLQYADYFFNLNVETEASWEALTTSPDTGAGLRRASMYATGQSSPAPLSSFTRDSALSPAQEIGSLSRGLVPTAADRNALQTARRHSRIGGAQRSARPMDIPASDLAFVKDLVTTPAGKACVSDIIDLTLRGLSLVPGVGCGKDLALSLVSTELGNAIQGNASVANSDPNVTGLNPYVVGPLVSALGCFPPTIPLKAIIDAAGAASAGAKAAVDCGKAYLKPSNGGPRVQIRGPGDPNFKAGPAGAGTQQYITPAQMLNYSVNFANEPTAGASAQNVTATDTIDANKVDLTSFAFGPVVIGNHSFVPAPNATSISTQIDLRPDVPILAQVTASVNTSTGLVMWQFGSLDPSTGQPISSNSLSGFLPPDTTMPDGEVAVAFSANLKSGLATGTTVSNTASIVFDGQPAMATNTWTNTIDADAPHSAVVALPASTPASATTVAWSGTDLGSGIASYTIYVSEDGGIFAPWLSNTASTSAIFTGQAGHQYGFFSVSVDAAGNAEAVKTAADTATTLNLAASTTTLKPVAGPVSANVAVTLSAAVVGTPNTAGVATGMATFYDGQTSLGSATLDGTGTATLMVTGFGSGSHSITVVYGGDANYSTSTSSAVMLSVVSLPAPTISLAVPNHTFGDAPFTLAAASNSNGAISYSVLEGQAGLAGSTLTLTGIGTVTVEANQAATSTFAAGMAITSFTVAMGTPVITWAPSTHSLNTGIPLGVSVLGASTTTPGSFEYTATASGGTPVPITALTALPAGSYVLTATFTPTDAVDYNVATAMQSFTVNTQHVWIVNSAGTVSSLDDAGNLLSETAVSGGGIGAAIDGAGDIWSINRGGGSLAEFSNTGAILSSGFTGGGLNAATALAIDGNGSVWVVNGNNSVSTFSNAGAALTPSTGFTGGALSTPDGVAIDLSGNVWISNVGNNSVTKILGGAAPAAPLATAVTNNTLGAKP